MCIFRSRTCTLPRGEWRLALQNVGFDNAFTERRLEDLEDSLLAQKCSVFLCEAAVARASQKPYLRRASWRRVAAPLSVPIRYMQAQGKDSKKTPRFTTHSLCYFPTALKVKLTLSRQRCSVLLRLNSDLCGTSIQLVSAVFAAPRRGATRQLLARAQQ